MKTRKEIKRYIEEVGTTSTEFFGGDFVGGYQLAQNPSELASLIKFLLDVSPFENVLEIGAYACGLSRVLCDLIEIKNYFVIDMPVDYISEKPTAQADNFSNLKISGKKDFFRGDSHAAECREWLKSKNIKFDFIFIDGDHSYNGVKKDTVLAYDFLDQDGFMAFHDTMIETGICNVKRFVDDLCGSNVLPDLDIEWRFDFHHRQGITLFQKI